MSHDSHTAFVGSVPEFYDRYMGPVFFDPYAADLVRRATPELKGAVLEVACGTGRLTRPLLAALPKDATLLSTDLNPPMIDQARALTPADPRLEFRPADAMTLPFADGAFDVAICQYGVMFFPDKVVAGREVRRVLKPGGAYWFNAWGSLADNESGLIAQQVMTELYPNDPPLFYETPFGYFDPARIHGDLAAAGFHDITITPVKIMSRAASARDLAIGMVKGTPASAYIAERGAPGHDAVVEKLTERFVTWGGAAPCEVPCLALVVRAVA